MLIALFLLFWPGFADDRTLQASNTTLFITQNSARNRHRDQTDIVETLMIPFEDSLVEDPLLRNVRNIAYDPIYRGRSSR